MTTRNTGPATLAAPPRQDRRQRPHRLLRFDLQVRVAILFASTITCLLAWFVPRSLTSVLLENGGVIGEAVLVLLTVATLVGYADVLINDLLPERFAWRAIKHRRHLGYSLIGGLYLLQAYVSVGDTIGPEDLLPLGYCLNAVMAGWFSWTTAWRGWHV